MKQAWQDFALRRIGKDILRLDNIAEGSRATRVHALSEEEIYVALVAAYECGMVAATEPEIFEPRTIESDIKEGRI